MLRAGVQHLIRQAVQVELDELLLQHANRVTRESTQSWREVLIKLKQRGINPPQFTVATSVWRVRAEARLRRTRIRMWRRS